MIATKDSSCEACMSEDNNSLASVIVAPMSKSIKPIKEIQEHYRKDILKYFLKGIEQRGCVIGLNKDLAETCKYSGIKLIEESSKILSESKVRSLFTSFKKKGLETSKQTVIQKPGVVENTAETSQNWIEKERIILINY